MHIDEDKLFTPWRTLKKGKKFSDHNAIILNLKITPQSSKASNSKITPQSSKASNSYRKEVWDFNNSSGWKRFHELTKNDEMLINIWKEFETIEISYERWMGRLNYLSGQCFKTISNKSKPFNSQIRALIKYRKDVKRTLFSTESTSSF